MTLLMEYMTNPNNPTSTQTKIVFNVSKCQKEKVLTEIISIVLGNKV